MKLKLFLFAFLFVFLSCSSDDETTSNEVSLVGTWELSSAKGSLSLDLNQDGLTSNSLLDELPCYKHTIVVKDDNTFTEESIGVKVDAEVTSAITAECLDTFLNKEGGWALDKDRLTFGYVPADDTKTVTIVVTETTLSFTDNFEGLGSLALEFTRK